MDLREQILEADDLPLVAVEVPEWGATVYVRNMTGYERDRYERSLLETKDDPDERMKNMRASLVVMCTCDESGNRIFADDDIDSVSQKSANALDRIVVAAQDMNRLSVDDIEDDSKN